MILMTINANSAKPKYQQIMEQIRLKIETRVLHPGEKLPSTRYLAAKLGVHRSTVALAYQELWALGFVELNPGTCPRVRERLQMVSVGRRSEICAIDWNKVVSPASNDIWQTHLRFRPTERKNMGWDLIDFSTLDMDCRLFPLEQFRSCLDRVMKNQGVALLGYGDRIGYSPLREYIACRL